MLKANDMIRGNSNVPPSGFPPTVIPGFKNSLMSG
jgi:hypothetical protein